MKITVCIGSSCHIKGSRQVVSQLQELISQNNLGDKVDLGGTFCMGQCQKSVCVTVDGTFHSVSSLLSNDASEPGTSDFHEDLSIFPRFCSAVYEDTDGAL